MSLPHETTRSVCRVIMTDQIPALAFAGTPA